MSECRRRGGTILACVLHMSLPDQNPDSRFCLMWGKCPTLMCFPASPTSSATCGDSRSPPRRGSISCVGWIRRRSPLDPGPTSRPARDMDVPRTLGSRWRTRPAWTQDMDMNIGPERFGAFAEQAILAPTASEEVPARQACIAASGKQPGATRARRLCLGMACGLHQHRAHNARPATVAPPRQNALAHCREGRPESTFPQEAARCRQATTSATPSAHGTRKTSSVRQRPGNGPMGHDVVHLCVCGGRGRRTETNLCRHRDQLVEPTTTVVAPTYVLVEAGRALAVLAPNFDRVEPQVGRAEAKIGRARRPTLPKLCGSIGPSVVQSKPVFG